MNRVDLEQLADHLIAVIRKRPGEYHNWAHLYRRLQATEEHLHRAVKIAASWDYRLKVRKSRGVAFIRAPDVLTATEIGYGLKTSWLAQKIHAYRSVKSTNDLAARMVETGAPEGTIVTAEQQTKGRGRLGRTWYSPPGAGIYVSIILRPSLPPEKAPGLAIMTAIALADTMEAYLPGKVHIKWPNDLLIGGRKAAGILTELSAERSRIHHVIIGVGINANHGVGSFPPELRKTSTSLRRALRRKVNRVELLQSFLHNFEKEYNHYLVHHLKKAHSRIRKYSSLIGRNIKVRSGKHVTSGLVTDIDATGCLILETKCGRVAITAGEVTIVKE